MIDDPSLRELQKESARALVLCKLQIIIFNSIKKAHHNSQLWYKAVIEWYVEQYGDLPSKVGPVKK